jgi:hypothetical protein
MSDTQIPKEPLTLNNSPRKSNFINWSDIQNWSNIGGWKAQKEG